MKKTLLSIFAFSGLIASAQITDVAFSSANTTVTVGGQTTITTDGSQLGYNYMLRDNSDNSVIGMPEAGTGGDLTFNTGTINNNTTYNILATNAITLQLNNDASVIELTNNTRTVDQEVTVAAWVKTPTSNGLTRNIVQQYGFNGEDAGYILRMTNQGRVSFTGRDNSTVYKTSGESAATITDDQWHYIVGTANIATGLWSIYIDGDLKNSQVNPVGTSLATSNSILKIGGMYSSARSIVGDVRDVTIWNRALSGAEVTTNFSNCISGSEANVVGHFKLNEGQGTTILDYSSIGINGTAVNLGTFPYPWITEATSCRDSLEMSQLLTVNVSNNVLVHTITVQGQSGVSEIVTDYGSLQMYVSIFPSNPDDASFTWSVVDGTGSATISPSGLLSNPHNGTVTVIATANDISGTSGSKVITLSNQSVGINEATKQNVKVYPNPVQNQLFIELATEQVAEVEIIDISGKVVRHISEANIKSIDVSMLNKGLYILKVNSEATVSTTQFIKQ